MSPDFHRSNKGYVMIEINKILSYIINRYKSMDEPNFSFVQYEFEKKPYKTIIDILSENYEITETTDLNDDVSFGYLLSKDLQQWFLQISMVGPFVALFNLNKCGKVLRILTNDNKDIGGNDTDIISVLLNKDLTLLDKKILEYPVPLKLFNTDVENVKVYQALFTDVDVLPWIN
jgi:hypothetical protein